MLPCFRVICGAKLCHKLLIMTTQKALRTSLPAILFLAFLLSPIRSNETITANDKRTFDIQLHADAENSSDQGIKIDFTMPLNSNHNKKDKDSEHNHDLQRHKRHADEDRHELHHHNFDKKKSRRRMMNLLLSFFLKIIIAVSYFSILLCSYMSIGH